MFTDKMTVLVEPSKAIVTQGVRSAGTYVWEKAQTLKVTQVTMQVRNREGIPMDPFRGTEGTPSKTVAWAEKETLGMTVRDGKLRLWGKGSKGFFSIHDVSRFGEKGMDSLVQSFLSRHGFTLHSDARESLTWAYAPDACALFGSELVRACAAQVVYGLSFSIIKKADIGLLFDTLAIAKYRDAAEDALRHQDYQSLRRIVVANTLGFQGEPEQFLELPFVASEIPSQGFMTYGVEPILPQEAMPHAIKAFDTRYGIWEVSGQPLELVPFNTGDVVEDWIAAVQAAYKIKHALEVEEQIAESARIRAERGLEDLHTVQEYLAGVLESEITSDMSKWQEAGLMDQDARGVLVWKAVSKDWRGVLGYQYTLAEPFANGGMAAVGPWGAVKEYGHQDSYVLALRVTEGGPVHAEGRPGVWYATCGTPVAQYLITEMTEEGFVPVLIAGTDEMALLTGVPSKRGEIVPPKPVVLDEDDADDPFADR